MMNNDFSMGFGSGFMWLWWIVIIVLVVWFIKFVVDSSGSNKTSNPKSALDILRNRYARGEIEEEEFERKRRDLEDE